MKAILELEFPKSCSDCLLRFIHTGYNDDEEIGCGFLNTDVTEYTESRHCDCPLNPSDNNGYIGYEDHIRIGNETDAIRLLEGMIEKCGCHTYFLPKLEALKDALERGII